MEGASDEPKPAPTDTEMQNETANVEQEDQKIQDEMLADLGQNNGIAKIDPKVLDNIYNIDIEGGVAAVDQMQNPYRLPDEEINDQDNQQQQEDQDQEEEEEEDNKSEQYSILVFMINNNTRYDAKFTIQWD